MRLSYWPLMAATLVFFGCRTQDPNPSPESSSKVNELPKATMTATINGKPWQAGGSPQNSGLQDVIGEIDPQSGYIRIEGKQYEYHSIKATGLEKIQIVVKKSEPGEYGLGPGFDSLQTALYAVGVQQPSSFFIAEHQAGKITITDRDTANRLLSGTFEFTAMSNDGKIVKVTNGHFQNLTY